VQLISRSYTLPNIKKGDFKTMSSDDQSSCTKDTVETRSISKVADETSMPSLVMEIGANAHFKHLQCACEIPLVIEIVCVDLDFNHPSITNYFQDRIWKNNDMKEWYRLNHLVDDLDIFDELEYDFKDFSASVDDDDDCCCDDMQDSIQLTRSRYRKRSVTTTEHYRQVIQDCSIE
jgi:hypothetical protein